MKKREHKIAMSIVEKAIESVKANADKVTTVDEHKEQYLMEQVIGLLNEHPFITIR